MRALTTGFAVALWLGASVSAALAGTEAKVTVLMDRLRVAEVVEIMRTEGLDYAQTLDTDMLGGQGGPFWHEQVTRIYEPQRMSETVREALVEGLDEPALDAALAFFGSDTGARIVALENAARGAMADPSIEEAARDTYTRLRNDHAPRLALIDRFVTVNDLLDRNVSGAMSSNFRFYRGMADGGALDMSEEDMLADVWSQEDEIRDDTEGWLYGYLLLAYEALEAGDLEDYVAFSQTAPGHALNAALFAGYETMYRDISYALGRGIALSLSGSDL